MKNACVLIVLLLVLIAFSNGTGPQTGSVTQPLRRIDPLKHYWGDLDGFFNRQAESTLDLVEEGLLRFPPALPEPLERRMALLMVDGVLHDVEAPGHSAVQEFFHARAETALKAMTATRIEEGAVIWKLSLIHISEPTRPTT